MWDIIAANRRKSLILIFTMGSLLAVLGAGIGYVFFSQNPADGVFWGIFIAMVIWIILLLTSYAGGEKILLATAGAREISKQEAPQLYNIVEEMKIASGLPVMPRVFVVDSAVPNAFAVGLNPERAAVAVTTGLVTRLNRDELQGVIAHEIGHIANRDTQFMTMAGVTLGAVVILADLFMRGLWFSNIGGGRRRSSSQGGGQLAAILMILTIVLAILAPIAAQIFYFAASRRREYLADASAARFTRYPAGLASALEKISDNQSETFSKSRTLAPMYIVNPMAAWEGTSSLFSTHPPTGERIQILRAMAGSSSLLAYEKAFRKEQRKELMTPGILRGTTEQGIRKPAPEPTKQDPQQNLRDIKDILHMKDGYLLILCACGVKLKVPPRFFRKIVRCPRCGRKHDVATEMMAASAALGTKPAK